jgi:hypothetical protein
MAFLEKYIKNNRKQYASMICGALMFSGNTNLYSVYKSLSE